MRSRVHAPRTEAERHARLTERSVLEPAVAVAVELVDSLDFELFDAADRVTMEYGYPDFEPVLGAVRSKGECA